MCIPFTQTQSLQKFTLDTAIFDLQQDLWNVFVLWFEDYLYKKVRVSQ